MENNMFEEPVELNNEEKTEIQNKVVEKNKTVEPESTPILENVKVYKSNVNKTMKGKKGVKVAAIIVAGAIALAGIGIGVANIDTRSEIQKVIDEKYSSYDSSDGTELCVMEPGEYCIPMVISLNEETLQSEEGYGTEEFYWQTIENEIWKQTNLGSYNPYSEFCILSSFRPMDFQEISDMKDIPIMDIYDQYFEKDEHGSFYAKNGKFTYYIANKVPIYCVCKDGLPVEGREDEVFAVTDPYTNTNRR